MPAPNPRDALLKGAKRVVVKVGSSLLAASPVGQPAMIADELASFGNEHEVVVVSSGAIALGYTALGFRDRPTQLPHLQAAAAIGQSKLIQNWERAFAATGVGTAQILLTHDDLGNRVRFLNARHALCALLDAGVVPIVNENDTVGTDEISYGDNDQLAALVCNLVSADVLILVTDVEGLCDDHPNRGGKRIKTVTNFDTQALPVATADSSSGLGRGGMASKVAAARNATHFGVPTIIVSGTARGALSGALRGEDVGTLFVPEAAAIRSRKHWLAYGVKSAGELIVDHGAVVALTQRGKSLLPAGLVGVRGDFGKGALVTLLNEEEKPFARGLVGYCARELRRLCGCRTTEIEALLGYKYLDEIVHRSDMVLL